MAVGDTVPGHVRLRVDDASFRVTLADTEAARWLGGRLPMSLAMRELNGNEKYAYLDGEVPTAATQPGTIHAGDIMLYGSDCLVLFYETFETGYGYTPVGRVDDPTRLAEVVGGGDVRIDWTVE